VEEVESDGDNGTGRGKLTSLRPQIADYATGKSLAADNGWGGLQGDPDQDLPAHATEVQPPDLARTPLKNDALDTIEQREDIDGGRSRPAAEDDKNNEE